MADTTISGIEDNYSTTFQSSNGQTSDKNNTETMVISTFYIICIVINLFGNGIVLTVMLTKIKQTYKTMGILLTSLALADILHGTCVGIPTVIQRFSSTWHNGTAVCKLYVFIRAIIGEVSVLTLALIGFDRFRVLRKPDSQPIKPAYLYTSLVMIWLYLILVGSPYLIVFEVVGSGTGMKCRFLYTHEAYTDFVEFVMTFGKIANFVVPVTFVLICYIGIIFKMRQTQRRVDSLHKGLKQIKRQKKQKQVSQLCFIIMTVFIIFWSPLRLVLILKVLYPADKYISRAIGYARMGTMLGSCLNPIIYGLMWNHFRDCSIEMLSPILMLWCPLWVAKRTASIVNMKSQLNASQQTRQTAFAREQNLSGAENAATKCQTLQVKDTTKSA